MSDFSVAALNLRAFDFYPKEVFKKSLLGVSAQVCVIHVVLKKIPGTTTHHVLHMLLHRQLVPISVIQVFARHGTARHGTARE